MPFLIVSCSVYGQVAQSNSQLQYGSANPIRASLISSDIKTSVITCVTFGFNLNEVNTPKGVQNIRCS